MDREKFIEMYIVTFMASYAARHYHDYCLRGLQHLLSDVGMIEEARSLAESVWDKNEWRNNSSKL